MWNDNKFMEEYNMTTTCFRKNIYSNEEIANSFGLSSRKLNQILKEDKIQFKKDNIWVLCDDYKNNDYCILYYKDYCIPKFCSRYWTEKGKDFLTKYLKEKLNREPFGTMKEKIVEI